MRTPYIVSRQSRLFVVLIITLFMTGAGLVQTVSAQDDATDAPIIFAAAGDHGSPMNSDTRSSLEAIRESGAEFYLAVGDMSYQEGAEEPFDKVTPSPWCSSDDPDINIKLTVGEDFPFQLLVGDNEDDSSTHGRINNYVLCLPDYMDSVGMYGEQYYFNYPQEDPLMRIIMLGAGTKVVGVEYDYIEGDEHYNWFVDAIDSAREDGIPWVIVGNHLNCITMGKKECEINPGLMELMIEKRVDLILQANEHNYQRSKQLSCLTLNTYDENCVADDGFDNEYTKGEGPVLVISGAFGGGSYYELVCDDPEREYFVTAMGNGQQWNGEACMDVAYGSGISVFEVTSDTLTSYFVQTEVVGGEGDPYEDRFVITRAEE